MGLMLRRVPKKAWAPPMRPPRFRNSRVATVKRTKWSARMRSSSFNTSARPWPAIRSSWALRTIMPTPREAAWESKTVTRPGKLSAARRADWTVPESLEEMWMERTWSAPFRASP
jgi:hypothetical protein